MDIPPRLKPMAAAANARAALTAKHYDALTKEKPGHEAPDDPKPIAWDAQMARTRAINDGRLIAPPRDEYVPPPKAPPPAVATTTAPQAPPPAPEKAAEPAPGDGDEGGDAD